MFGERTVSLLRSWDSDIDPIAIGQNACDALIAIGSEKAIERIVVILHDCLIKEEDDLAIVYALVSEGRLAATAAWKRVFCDTFAREPLPLSIAQRSSVLRRLLALSSIALVGGRPQLRTDLSLSIDP